MIIKRTLLATVSCATLAVASFQTAQAQGSTPQTDLHGISIFRDGQEATVPDHSRAAYEAYETLAETYPNDFGYVSYDTSKRRVSVPVTTAKGRTLLRAFESGRAPTVTRALAGDAVDAVAKRQRRLNEVAVVADQVRVTATPTNRSRAATERDASRIADLAASPALKPADVWMTGPDRRTGKVIVTVSRITPGLTKSLAKRFGPSKVSLEVAPNPRLKTLAGRRYDGSPFYGGALITTPQTSCTTAFSWRVNGVPAMVTAGHCIPYGGRVRTPKTAMGWVSSGSRENWHPRNGTQTVPGFSGYHGDGAIIEVKGKQSSSPRIYRGDSDTLKSGRVKAAPRHRAKSGDKFCTGGASTDEICGWGISRTGTNVRYEEPGRPWARNVIMAVKRGYCLRGGDSGGSAFVSDSRGDVIVRGVISGGSGNGTSKYPCRAVVTDYWDIYQGLPGYLAK